MGAHYIVRLPTPTLTLPRYAGEGTGNPSPVRALSGRGRVGWGVRPGVRPSHRSAVEPPATPVAEAVAAVGLVEANTENIAIGSHLWGVVARVHVVVGQGVEAGDALFNSMTGISAPRSRSTRAGSGGPRRAFEATLADTRERLRFAERVQNPWPSAPRS